VSWQEAANHLERAVEELRKVRVRYADASLHPDRKRARLAAIDSKIDALNGVYIPPPNCWPWCDDGVDA
jgi:hypothetical protein